MKTKNIKYIICLIAVLLSGCTKDALNKKSDIHLVVASTLDDYQQLLDGLAGGSILNTPGLPSYGTLGDYLSDDVYVSDNSYNNYFVSDPFTNKLIKWDKTMFSSLSKLDEWNNQYKIVLNANVALEGLKNIAQNASNQAAYDNVKGTALFFRAQMFYNLALFWCKPYNSATASSDPGIVLRLSSDATVKSVRSNAADTYKQIISDLNEAISLLPNTSSQNTQLSKIRPSKAAAYALLARTYLQMGDYANVLKYADASLQLYSPLLNYSTLSTSPTFRFNRSTNFNSEIVFYSVDLLGVIGNTFGFWNVNQALYNSYSDNDLRKQYFYNPSIFFGLLFAGDYSGTGSGRFTGIATDEIYLMRAEGYARTGNTTAAVADINTLLSNRYKPGTYVNFTAVTADDALVKIIAERRKELIGRAGIRWSDLKRLNSDPRFAVTLSRTLLGTTYTLPPNDSRYTLQIPDYIISASNGSIQQTP